MKKLLTSLILLASITGIAYSQEVRLPERPKTPEYIDYSNQNTGFWCTAGMSTTLSFNGENKMAGAAALDLVAGYRLNEFIRFGLGVSPQVIFLNKQSSPSRTIVPTPLYADFRGNFLPQNQRMFSPYWSMDLGYAFGYNGFYASPTLGLKIGSIRNDFLLGLFFVFQQQNVDKSFEPCIYSLGLRLAYEF